MACTTILVGRSASHDGSTIIARNEDSSNGTFSPKRFSVVMPEDQPRRYESVLGHFVIDLPENPLRYTSVPDVLPGHGIWGEAGVNELDVAMSATETLTTNERVLGADPLLVPSADPKISGGLGEEDLLTVVLPYIRSAREGVERLGALLGELGTYECNGVAFSDTREIWWLETVGGHHWIARRVPDDAYVTMPNQLGIDSLDLDDALGAGRNCLCSPDLATWMAENHLDLGLGPRGEVFCGRTIDPRAAFGSHSERDHVYNTPRAWYMQRTLNPSDSWEGPDATWGPESDDIPWSRVPERKLTIEDVKLVLSSHYEGTPFDPYGTRGSEADRRRYRVIGINRNSQLAVLQLREGAPAPCRALQWMAFGSNSFNTLAPFYANVTDTPAYLRDTEARVSTETFYWANRIIAGLADAHFSATVNDVDAYRQKTMGFGHQVVRETDAAMAELVARGGGDGNGRDDGRACHDLLEAANERMAAELRCETDALLGRVLYSASMGMRNGFALSDN